MTQLNTGRAFLKKSAFAAAAMAASTPDIILDAKSPEIGSPTLPSADPRAELQARNESAMDHRSGVESARAGIGPWYRRTLRWGQTNITEIDPERYDPSGPLAAAGSRLDIHLFPHDIQICLITC